MLPMIRALAALAIGIALSAVAGCASKGVDPEYQHITGLDSAAGSFAYEQVLGEWRNVWSKSDALLVRQSYFFFPDHTVIYQVQTRNYAAGDSGVYLLYKGTVSVEGDGSLTAALYKVQERVTPAGSSCAFCTASIASELKLVHDRLLLLGPFDQFGLHGAFIAAARPAAYAGKFRQAVAKLKIQSADLEAELQRLDRIAAASPEAPEPPPVAAQAAPAAAPPAAAPAPAAQQPAAPAVAEAAAPANGTSAAPACEAQLAEHRRKVNAQPYSSWSACQGLRYMLQSQAEYIAIVQAACPAGAPVPYQGVELVRGAMQAEQETLPAVCGGP